MADLGEARKKIDKIDEELVKLFLERLSVAREVALAKRENGGSVTRPRARDTLPRLRGCWAGERERRAAFLLHSLFDF